MNLSFFRTESIDFSEDMLRQGRSLYEAGLLVKPSKWREGAGPVWTTADGDTLCGFQVDRGTYPRQGAKWRPLCSCKICLPGDCPHVVALFFWIEMEAKVELERWQDHFDESIRRYGHWGPLHLTALPSLEDQFETWIATQDRLHEAERYYREEVHSPKKSTGERVLFFFGRPSGIVPAPPSLRMGLSRPLKSKKGGAEQMSKVAWLARLDYRMSHLLSSDATLRRFVEWSAVNDALHRSIPGLDDDEEQAPVYVRDDEGLAILSLISQEGRLYTLNDDERPLGPLRIGDERKLEWRWNECNVGYWQVRPVSMPNSDLFISSLPLYVDTAEKTFGRLDLDGMPAARAASMLKSPPIPKAWINANAQSSEAVKFLPRPPGHVVKRSTRLISGITPTPVLTVAISGKDEVFSIDIAFNYGEVSKFFEPGDDPVQFIRRGRGTTELVRDVLSEAKALGVVTAAGMVVSKDGALRFEGAREAQIKGFRGLLATDFATFRAASFEIHTVEGWSSRVVLPEQVEGGLAREQEGVASSALMFSLGFFLDGQRYNLLPLVPQLLDLVGGADGINALQVELDGLQADLESEEPFWVLDDEAGRWIGLPRRAMLPWLRTLIELFVERKVREFMAPSLQLSRIDALRLEADLPDVDLGGDAADVVRELLDAKTSTDDIRIDGFEGELLPFQRAGFRWLSVLAKHGLGGMLGDDRGLGKTVQCVAHLADMKHRGVLKAPALIVAPSTQVHHWRYHIKKMVPAVKSFVLIGADRAMHLRSLGDYDAVITSWDSVTRFVEQLSAQHFQLAFLDETEKIHNPSTQVAKALRLLDIGYEIALNGSPLENNYGDVWAVIDAVLPGYLGTQAGFKRQFRDPIEASGDTERIKKLRMRLAPFMLRRLKSDTGVELPPVIHEDVPLRLAGAQANLYELIRISTAETVREAMAAKGLAAEPLSILPILTKLRQVCCDPSMTDIGRERGVTGSAKLEWLLPRLDVMLAEGRRILLVGFFVEFFGLIEEALLAKDVAYSKIVGSMTPAQREVQKTRFKEGLTRVFLLGLKSGGRGTDLPEADTVIHLDPWYNPKAHDQATDRAHRIGQVNTVVNLRLFIEGSIEERVIEIQDRKRRFADSLDSLEIFDEHKVTKEDIDEMLKPLDFLDELMPA